MLYFDKAQHKYCYDLLEPNKPQAYNIKYKTCKTKPVILFFSTEGRCFFCKAIFYLSKTPTDDLIFGNL